MTADWQHALEIHPPDWRFPAGKSWIAGWLVSRTGRAPADVRAWIDNRPFLGLCALPRPDVQQSVAGHTGTPVTGFSFLLEPHRGARRLRLEVCDLSGRWEEFAALDISVSEDAQPSPAEPVPDYAALLRQLLQAHRRSPATPLGALASEVVAELRAQPLDTEPNPPFWGKLEEPTATGRLKYGRLTVTGWLAHQSHAITTLTAVLDPEAPIPLRHSLPRRDVSGLFTELRDTTNSQFLGNVNLPPDLPLPAALRIFATLDNGHTELVFTRRFRPSIIPGDVPALPSFSPLLFARAALALRRAAKSQGLPTTGLLAAARSVWAANHSISASLRPPSPRLKPLTSSLSSPSRPLRLLLVTHNLNLEGAPILLFEQARHHATMPGVNVRVVSPEDGPLRARYEALGIPVEIWDTTAIHTATEAAQCDAAIAALAAAHPLLDVDLVVGNTVLTFWTVALATRFNKPSLLYIYESSSVEKLFAGAGIPAHLRADAAASLHDATRVCFAARATLAVHQQQNLNDNFRLLPSAVDVARIERFVASTDRLALRQKHGITADVPLVINVGSVCERKGQHIYLRGIARLRNDWPSAFPDRPFPLFLIVGARESLYLEAIRQEMAVFQLSDTVRVIPENGEVDDFFRMADLLVSTSFEESFPRVLLEAMVFGVRIVSTDVFGAPEMLVANDEAHLIPAGDPAELAATLAKALGEHFAGDNRKIAAAHTRVLRDFDTTRLLPQHLALCREAALG
jgi:glycosyltransferase involved in cell wall biosynthesis